MKYMRQGKNNLKIVRKKWSPVSVQEDQLHLHMGGQGPERAGGP